MGSNNEYEQQQFWDMESNKYYIPTIEEFYVGFECEVQGLKDGEVYWQTIILKNIDALITMRGMVTRVKYLDQEDIESLGWKKSRNTNTSEIEFELDLGNPLDNLGLLYDTENQYLRIHWFGEGDITRFSGTIKNKSELKKLMKQLGINEN